MNDPGKQTQERAVCSREECERRLKTYINQLQSMRYSQDRTKLVKLHGHIEELCFIGKFNVQSAQIQEAMAGVMEQRPQTPEVSTAGLPSLGGAVTEETNTPTAPPAPIPITQAEGADDADGAPVIG